MSLTGAAGEWHDVYFTDSAGTLTNDITAAGLYTIAITGLYMRFVLASSTDPAIVVKTAELLNLGGN
jgi:hypothetical protein